MSDAKYKAYARGDAIGAILMETIEMAHDLESAPAAILGLKLSEECGEFCEAMSKELGFLKHKELKEPLMGEAADVINVVIAAVVQTYPEKSADEISEELIMYLKLKNEKYKKILEEFDNDK